MLVPECLPLNHMLCKSSLRRQQRPRWERKKWKAETQERAYPAAPEIPASDCGSALDLSASLSCFRCISCKPESGFVLYPFWQSLMGTFSSFMFNVIINIFGIKYTLLSLGSICSLFLFPSSFFFPFSEFITIFFLPLNFSLYYFRGYFSFSE